jgi:preprotein translocase subunit YajC
MPQSNLGTAGAFSALVPFILIILIFYFILIRPQVKREKEMDKMRSNLQKGDNVVTSGGICGTVVDFKADRVIVKVDDRTNIMVLRSAVSGLQEAPISAKEEEIVKKA